MFQKYCWFVSLIVILISIAGCTTASNSVDEQFVVRQIIEQFSEAATVGDIDNFMGLISEDFTSDKCPDKDAYRKYMTRAKALGHLDNDLEVRLDDMQIEFKAGKAIAYPVEIRGTFGSARLQAILTKERGAWRITCLNTMRR